MPPLRTPFRPSSRRPRFLLNVCRHKGAITDPDDQPSFGPDAISRLLDDARDAEKAVRVDDWHPDPDSPFFQLDLADIVQSRRQQLKAALAEVGQ